MDFFFPHGLIWNPDNNAIWTVPIDLIFTFLLMRGIFLKLYGNKVILVIYVLGIIYNLIGAISELTYLTLHVPNNIFNYIWFINIIVIIYEQYFQRRKLNKKELSSA